MKPRTQKRLRAYHNWLGVFFAPGIIFFALSGILQTFGLHESGPNRTPAAAWIGLLANIHKEDEAALPKRRPAPRAIVGKPATEQRNDAEERLPLFKIYVLLLSLALIAAAGMGIIVAFTNRASRQRTTVLLLAGAVVPPLLLAL